MKPTVGSVKESVEQLEELSWLTKLQAAKFVGVSDKTITNAVSAGKLTVRYEGRNGMYDINQLRTLKASNEQRLNIRNIRQGGNSEVVHGEEVTSEREKGESEQEGNRKEESTKGRSEQVGNRKEESEKMGTTLAIPKSRNVGSQQVGNTAQLFVFTEEAATQFAKKAIEESRGVGVVNLVDKMVLTIPEAMALSGFKEKPLRDAIKSGDLPSIHIGRSKQVRPSDLRKWVDSKFGK